MSHRFFDAFPPPIFLTMPAVGLSVESDALRLLSFEKKHGHTVLKTSTEFPLPAGAVVAGEILQPKKVADVLKTIHDKHDVRYVRLVLPEEKAYVYDAVIPMPEAGEIGDAVEFSLEQNIPLSPAEAVFDFSVIEGPFANAANGGVQSVRVVVLAYPRAVVESWAGLLRGADIVPLLVTPESQAIAHALVPKGDTRTALFVHFLKDKAVLAVVSGGQVRFSTTVTTADEKAQKILSAHDGEHIAESIELLAVRDEVKKVFSYWMSKEGVKSKTASKNIQSVVVTGHIADMTDVAEYIGKHVGVPAILGNVWQNAFSLEEYVPDIEFTDSLVYAATVGAALPR